MFIILYASQLLSLNLILSLTTGVEEFDVTLALVSVGIATPLALLATSYLTSSYLKSFNGSAKASSCGKVGSSYAVEKKSPPNATYLEKSTIIEERIAVSVDIPPFAPNSTSR